MRRVNNLVASILGGFAFLTAGTPRRYSRILPMDLVRSKSGFTMVGIANRGCLGEAHNSDISTTSLLNRSCSNERETIRRKRLDFALDESTAVREGVGVATPGIVELFNDDGEGTWCVCSRSVYMKHRDRIDSSSGRRTTRVVALADANRTSRLSLFLSLSFCFFFFFLSLLTFSHSLTRLVSCASPVNHGDSYFCISSSSSATMPDYRLCRGLLSRDIPRHA